MRFWCLLFLALLSVFCRENNPDTTQQTPVAPQQSRPKIIALGDSLTSGLGLSENQTYPAQLQKMLEADGYQYEVINAGVSGDTSSGGLRRLDWSLQENVAIVIVELGGNDILRGHPVELTEKNISEIIERIQAHGATPVLAGIEAPTNAGPEYRKEVHEAFRKLSEKYSITFIPFILEGLVGKEQLIQEDGTHPNAEGAKVMAQNVYKAIQPLLKR